ncbi:MAG: orotidine-5'-phosphate decarboxylase [Peptococcaceae bacterium]|nr:orotidine-5'-phosphate decarboxylase [Peptococcaceae bacterium]
MNLQERLSPISQVIVALDVDNIARAHELARLLQGTGCWLKIGMELYALSGISLIDEFKSLGFHIFLDLKLHDIPTTVERTLRVLAASGADMITVHCLGGYDMMARAADVCHQADTLLMGVTVLTSMDEKHLADIGVTQDIDNQVVHLAQLAHRAGLDGVVASAHEVPNLRKQLTEFLLVTPGIRPAGSETNDQARVLTPQAALDAGSSYLVVGRPITQSPDPRQALLSLF